MEQHPTCAPPPAPVPVAGAVVPVDFKVVKKGPEMAMHDAIGRLAFRAAGRDSWATALHDDAGGVLVTVRSSGQGEWQAFSGNSLEQRHIIFTAKVISASSSRKEVHVFISPRSTVEDSKPSYRLIGSTYRRACTIIKGDSIVAQTNLLYKLKKTIYSRPHISLHLESYEHLCVIQFCNWIELIQYTHPRKPLLVLSSTPVYRVTILW